MSDPARFAEIRARYPSAPIVGASSSGEVLGPRVYDGTLAVTALTFDSAAVEMTAVELLPGECPWASGQRLGAGLPLTHRTAGPLRHVLVFADGVHLNGSEFARGLEDGLPDGVAVTGGLAADHAAFERTPIWADRVLEQPGAVAVGLYGAALRIGFGAIGGWDPFGPERLVTRSDGNLLYELDGRSALALYKDYLGPHAEQLPASGLLFPLSIRTDGPSGELVRTTLGVDEEAQAIRFAGDIPEGSYARFMKTNLERLIDGAAGAAEAAAERAGGVPAEFALVVSCVGRRMALTQRVEEELDEVSAVLGGVPMTGFYSHGELAPARRGGQCELHNQTMTLTTFSEG